MKKNYKRFYMAADHELLGLAEYLKMNLLKLRAVGDWDVNKQKHFDAVNQVPEIVDNFASLRHSIWENLPENDKNLQKHRVNVNCEYCNAMRKVKIVGATTNELFGWKLDKVKCSVCKRVFVNYLPNTCEERKLWNINMIEQLTTVRGDGKTDAEKMADKMDMQVTLKQMQGFVDAQTKLEGTIAIMKLQDEKNKKSIEEMRDAYLKQKIKVDKAYKIDGTVS